MGQICTVVYPTKSKYEINNGFEKNMGDNRLSDSFHGGPLIKKPDGTFMSLQPLNQVIHRMPYYNPMDGFILSDQFKQNDEDSVKFY